jgi:hypothetical protein
VARFWRERYVAGRHSNKMKGEIDGVYQFDVDLTPRDNLLVRWVYFVNVCQFEFQFLSLRQIEVCLEYFRKKIPGSRRIYFGWLPGGTAGNFYVGMSGSQRVCDASPIA